ncbi:hypothetical protein KA005_08820, partial [bacterium]|nr:hypothetical protein [bacterium]
QKCSHAIYLGEGKDRNGKVWRWEFKPSAHSGPLFTRKNGEPLKNQPIASWHRAWEPFEAWHTKLKQKEIAP